MHSSSKLPREPRITHIKQSLVATTATARSQQFVYTRGGVVVSCHIYIHSSSSYRRRALLSNRGVGRHVKSHTGHMCAAELFWKYVCFIYLELSCRAMCVWKRAAPSGNIFLYLYVMKDLRCLKYRARVCGRSRSRDKPSKQHSGNDWIYSREEKHGRLWVSRSTVLCEGSEKTKIVCDAGWFDEIDVAAPTLFVRCTYMWSADAKRRSLNKEPSVWWMVCVWLGACSEIFRARIPDRVFSSSFLSSCTGKINSITCTK